MNSFKRPCDDVVKGVYSLLVCLLYSQYCLNTANVSGSFLQLNIHRNLEKSVTKNGQFSLPVPTANPIFGTVRTWNQVEEDGRVELVVNDQGAKDEFSNAIYLSIGGGKTFSSQP
ncbi:hypothetical protein BDN67DRAFT_907 [Paxillus ammoniavirescens]|nr:hypothetical protein BDN67DRAFT_907 [Paxillus ammoniavirescens]